ncbi:hypothetical protein [Streptomyces sp. NPDC096030]|uniref:hypothetical protein n=1 Tax=Streptomyces sp. NPDC096030 TaxID=3155423 RepID=UPI003326E713
MRNTSAVAFRQGRETIRLRFGGVQLRMALFARGAAALALCVGVACTGVAQAAPSGSADAGYCQEDPQASPAANAVAQWACAQVGADSCQFGWGNPCVYLDTGFVRAAWKEGGIDLEHMFVNDLCTSIPVKVPRSRLLPGDVAISDCDSGWAGIYVGGGKIAFADQWHPVRALTLDEFQAYFGARPA